MTTSICHLILKHSSRNLSNCNERKRRRWQRKTKYKERHKKKAKTSSGAPSRGKKKLGQRQRRLRNRRPTGTMIRLRMRIKGLANILRKIGIETQCSPKSLRRTTILSAMTVNEAVESHNTRSLVRVLARKKRREDSPRNTIQVIMMSAMGTARRRSRRRIEWGDFTRNLSRLRAERAPNIRPS